MQLITETIHIDFPPFLPKATIFVASCSVLALLQTKPIRLCVKNKKKQFWGHNKCLICSHRLFNRAYPNASILVFPQRGWWDTPRIRHPNQTNPLAIQQKILTYGQVLNTLKGNSRRNYDCANFNAHLGYF